MTTTDTFYGGWRIGDESLLVGKLPGRRSIWLYTEGKGRVTQLARCQDETSARALAVWLDRLAQANYKAPSIGILRLQTETIP